MNSAPQSDEDMLSCLGKGSVHRGAQVAWLVSPSTSLPERSHFFELAGMYFCFVLDKIPSSGHYWFGLELFTMAGSITPIEVRAEVVVSTTDRTRRFGDQSFKGNFDRENTLFGVDNILLGKTVAQEGSFLFEVTFYTTEFAKPYEVFWQEPAGPDVVIVSSGGSAPVLVNQAIVLRASPTIKDIVTIRKPADVSSIDHHHPHHAQSIPTSSPNDECLVDLSESSVSLVAMSTPTEPNEEQLLMGESIQDCPQPAGGNRKTRRKMQKKPKTHHHGPMMASNASVSEEGPPMEMADGYTSAQSPSPSPSSSSLSSSSLLLSERFSDVASSEHNTPKLSPAVLHSPIHTHAKEDPISVAARSRKEVWIWPQDLPASSCEMIMRWIYLGTVPSAPLKDFNAMYALLCRLSNRVLLQAYVTVQRRAIEAHPSPLDLLAAADYNVGAANVLLRPVLVATIKKKWSSISTGTALASMFTGPDPSGVLLSVIQTLSAPQG